MTAVSLPRLVLTDDEACDMNHHADLCRLDFASLVREEARIRLAFLGDRRHARVLATRLAGIEALLRRQEGER